jgi:N,N'-diacetylchitobiose phosphorylase
MRYGYFDDENREYVIERPDIPVSWTNYLGVKDMCTVISQNAGGYSFYKSTQHYRITRFRPNGVPLDRPGHYVYLRDDDTGDYWSISWQPVGKDLKKARYECRHGLSYSKFICDYNDIHAEQLMFIPVEDDVELWDVRIRNTGERVRKISIFSYVEFSFHEIDDDNQNFQYSLYTSGSSYKDSIIEYNFFYPPKKYDFFTSSFDPDSYDCIRDRFLGNYRTESNPIAVEQGQCFNSSELTGNVCGALHKRILVHPGEEVRVIFMLGVGPRDPQGYLIRKKYSDLANVDKAFEELKEYWRRKLSVFQCRTPHQGLNTMVNTWTLYQAETCVVWSRFASFIEVGGRTGLGYRDTAQDAMSIPHTNPKKVKQRLVELLNGQVSTGYALHLFDPEVLIRKRDLERKTATIIPSEKKVIIHGVEEACSDDFLWLVVSICEYVKETGELSFFNEVVPFADKGEATVYEHIKRGLDFSIEQVGPHKICKGLRADWNDCLNLGGGESAMVSFMLYWALKAFIEAAKYIGKIEDVEKYSLIAEEVRKTCEDVLWDGEWYIRGITAKGIRIGSRNNEEGKIFIESNCWAVVSGVASEERGRKCMDAVDKYLYSKYGLHLVWPAFSKPDDDIGFITRVYKGVKENGSIFSHTNTWAVVAECKLGRGNQAMKIYDAILPYNQNDIIEIREAEPYSYCQFIYGRDHPAFGRARHPWLTGSAGWFYVAATRWILGIRPCFNGLLVDPCIPSDWKEFEVTRVWRGATYHIVVKNPNGVQKGVKTITLNGRPVENPIPPQEAGSVNEVIVVMG